MEIVAFGHQKQVGKGTAAHFLQRILQERKPGVRVKQWGFADKLKDVCYQLYAHRGMLTSSFYEENPTEKETIIAGLGKSARQIWIEVGNHMREVYPETWRDYVLGAKQLQQFDYVLVPDLRFPNEHAALHNANNALIVKITRAGLPEPTDVSDTALNGNYLWDAVIENNGSLTELYKKLEDFYDVHMG